MRRFLCFLALLLVLGPVALAQSTTNGAIGGIVKDPQGAVVPNASITVRNEETNKESTGTSDGEGRFRIVQLQPGNYTVTVNAPGFSTYTQQHVVVEVGRETALDVSLSVSGAQATVVVTSEAPVINTSQQDFSTNVNQVSINELPINGRRWSNFALLTPGAVPDGTFGLISFRGISGLLNNNTVDGGDNNQAFFSEERGRTRIGYVISQAAIREFQVNTSNYSAEYGRAAGGVVNAVTKSGTNELHGSGFYYQRNNKWGARNPLSFLTQNINGVFTPVAFKPKDVRHQFGGTLGGPIVKDKAFFFFSYDQQKRNFPGVARFSQVDFLNRVDRCLLTSPLGATVTLAQCPAYPGTSNPSRTGSLATGKGLTNAQVDQALNFLNSLSGEVPRRGDQRLILGKIDWNINSKNTLSATYNSLRWDSPNGIQTQAINTRAKDNFGDDFVDVDFLNLRLTSSLTARAVNEFRFQAGRDKEYEFSQPPLPGEPTTAPGGRSPQVFITNGFSFGIPDFLERPAFPDERRFQFADTLTLTLGQHTVKFGGDINRVKDIVNNIRFLGGEYNYTGGTNAAGFYSGLNDFIIDYINFITQGGLPANTPCYSSTRTRGKCYGGNFNQGLGVPGLSFHTTDFNLFIQDDWRVSSRLTLNLGLRYEYQINPDPVNVNPDLPQTANKVSDKNNFGPRIGLAYDLTGDGKTVLRGGYGIYYGRVINSTIYNALINTGVGTDRGQRQVTLTASNPAAPVFPNLLSAGTLVPPQVQYFASNFQNPQIHQADLIFEREVARNTVVSASYLFSFGRYLPTFVDTNLNPPVFARYTIVGGPYDGQVWLLPVFVGSRPNPNYQQITEIRSNVISKYNALVLQANRRLTNGLQFQTSYTLSRASDTGQTSQTFTSPNVPFNPFDQAAENGLSNFDRRHKFIASVVWQPTPFDEGSSRAARAIFNGWTISPILNAFSGQRYSATVSGTVNPVSLGFPSGTQTPPGGGGVNGVGSTRFALAPRNSFKMPSIWYLDMRLSRRFSITEKARLEFLAEAFNLFNRTQVTGVNTALYSISGSTLQFNTAFGTPTAADSTLFRERQVQLAVRFEF
ncbi:TonB-dependent receptor [Pyrinomonas methylaliphatogenes]|uniref:Outer membrane receptor for ferrienterochelin and colicins n=1 Tax=Pyrinomonas methylaliphatogenes TaxID=454194 RepID=A0A0B6X3G1_9BACT|nr:carboxypeptidase regulatory-like domain-containing protein [Pyrinomonas methylaliphatogenes]CDM66845.1 outer membrane receptor for ferrienterochelin and colicins [Pyrinomonas methylaliphatogenes]